MTEEKWIVDWNTGAETNIYEYEYDSDGYPTKRISTYSNGSKDVTDFAYKQF